MTGCSDASIKIFHLVTLPSGHGHGLVSPMRDLTLREMLEGDVSMAHDEADERTEDSAAAEKLVIEKARTCWTSCVCPPGLAKPDSTKCGRCFNRGHTELVRSLHLGEEVMLSGSYDSTIRVSFLCSSWEVREQADEWVDLG